MKSTLHLVWYDANSSQHSEWSKMFTSKLVENVSNKIPSEGASNETYFMFSFEWCEIIYDEENRMRHGL